MIQQSVINSLTVDVEDYFHVEAFSGVIRRECWEDYPIRADVNTMAVLDLLERYSVRGTFFVLGWLAEKRKWLVEEISRRGHEVGSHGYGHQFVARIGPENFRNDIRRSKGILEDILGRKVVGYRAPSFSITADSLWALDILGEEGFEFDSSIFPIVHDLYGIPSAERFPHTIPLRGGSIREFPISTVRVWKVNLPISGGGYLRILPFEWIRRGIARLNREEEQPAVVYFHPWEIDPHQPLVRAPLKSRIRHYWNLEKTMGRLERLFDEFSFAPMGEVLGMHRGKT